MVHSLLADVESITGRVTSVYGTGGLSLYVWDISIEAGCRCYTAINLSLIKRCQSLQWL